MSDCKAKMHQNRFRFNILCIRGRNICKEYFCSSQFIGDSVTTLPRLRRRLGREIIEIVTRCQIARLKCTKIDFGLASPQTLLGSLQRSPRSPSWNKGNLLLREGEGAGKGKGGKATPTKSCGICSKLLSTRRNLSNSI